MNALRRFSRFRMFLAGGAAMLPLLALPTGSALATEGATNFYLLGQRGQGAAVLPPVEGVFFALPNYFYSGDQSGGRSLELGGTIATGVDADVFLTLPSAIWVTPIDILGGDLAFNATLVYGNADISARSVLTFPNIGGNVDLSDDQWAVGDPVVGAAIGWHGDNHHYLLAANVNIPAGDYDKGRLANVSINRWASDLTAAGTWLFADKAFELSAAAGFTFNGENDDTDYDSGNEMHVEGAAFYQLTPAISVGLNGFYYKQVSGDSGSGARLGDFKGRVAGIGPGATFNFQVGPAPVTVNLRYISEFEAEKRLEGDIAWLTVALPLWVPSATTP